MLRLRVDFLHVPNEMRPLSHGITAAFGVQLGVPLYTERNETAFGVLLDTERETGPLSHGITWHQKHTTFLPTFQDIDQCPDSSEETLESLESFTCLTYCGRLADVCSSSSFSTRPWLGSELCWRSINYMDGSELADIIVDSLTGDDEDGEEIFELENVVDLIFDAL